MQQDTIFEVFGTKQMRIKPSLRRFAGVRSQATKLAPFHIISGKNWSFCFHFGVKKILIFLKQFSAGARAFKVSWPNLKVGGGGGKVFY